MKGPSERQRAWARSARFHAIRCAALARVNASRADRPKCGARRKSNGQPCENVVAAPGLRCRIHGGATPKGKNWHKPQPPGRGAPLAKLAAKEAALARRRAEQEARRRAMTPEERARHDAWHAARKPGGPAARERRRRDLAAQAMLAGADAAHATLEAPETAEARARLQSMIQEREAALVALRAPQAAREEGDGDDGDNAR